MDKESRKESRYQSIAAELLASRFTRKVKIDRKTVYLPKRPVQINRHMKAVYRMHQELIPEDFFRQYASSGRPVGFPHPDSPAAPVPLGPPLEQICQSIARDGWEDFVPRWNTEASAVFIWDSWVGPCSGHISFSVLRTGKKYDYIYLYPEVNMKPEVLIAAVRKGTGDKALAKILPELIGSNGAQFGVKLMMRLPDNIWIYKPELITWDILFVSFFVWLELNVPQYGSSWIDLRDGIIDKQLEPDRAKIAGLVLEKLKRIKAGIDSIDEEVAANVDKEAPTEVDEKAAADIEEEAELTQEDKERILTNYIYNVCEIIRDDDDEEDSDDDDDDEEDE